MSVVWTNLDFEYELRFRQRRVNKHLKKMNSRWSHILRLMPGFRDAEPAESGAGEAMVWGVTPTAADRFKKLPFIDIEVVRLVNSKLFSHALEIELECALPGARVVSDEGGVAAALVDTKSALIKHPFGVSGRERIEVRESVTDVQHAWIRNHLSETQLVFEPKVHISDEYSLQYDLGASVSFVGASALLTDSHGQHRGHRRRVDVPSQVIEIAHIAAERVHQEGYRGPLGIDAFSGELDGTPVHRPLCEINARVTFGRLALELFRVDGDAEVWWHPSEARRGEAGRLLPDFCDPDGKSGSVLLDNIDLERIAL